MGAFKSKHAINNKEGGEEAKDKDGVEFKGMKKISEGKGGQSNGVEEEMIQGQATGNLHAGKPGSRDRGGGSGLLNVDTAVQPIDDVLTTDDESMPAGIGVVKAGGIVEPQKVGEPRILKHETQQEKVIQSKEEVLQNGAVLETTTEIVTKKRIVHMEQDVINGDDEIRESRKEVITMETSRGGTAEAAALILEMEKAKFADTVEADISEDCIVKTEAKKPVEAHNPMLNTFRERTEEELQQERIAKAEAKEQQSAPPPVVPVPAALEPEEPEEPEIDEELIQSTEAKKPDEADPIMKLEMQSESSHPITVESDEIIVAQEAKRPDQPEASGLLAEFREKTDEEKEQDRLALEKTMEDLHIAPTPTANLVVDVQPQEEDDAPEIEEESIQKAEAKKPEESVPEMPAPPVIESKPDETQQCNDEMQHSDEIIVAQEAKKPDQPEAVGLLAEFREKTDEEKEQDRLALEKAMEDLQTDPTPTADLVVDMQPQEEDDAPEVEEESIQKDEAKKPEESVPEMPAPPVPEIQQQQHDDMPHPTEPENTTEQIAAPEDVQLESIPCPDVSVEPPLEPAQAPSEEKAPSETQADTVDDLPPPPVITDSPDTAAPVESSQQETVQKDETPTEVQVPSEAPMEQQSVSIEEQHPVEPEAEPKPESEVPKDTAEPEVTQQEVAPVEESTPSSVPTVEEQKDNVVEKAESEGQEKASDEPSEAEVAEAVDAVTAAVMEDAVTEAAQELNKDSQPTIDPTSAETKDDVEQDDTPIASDVPEDSSTDSLPTAPQPTEEPKPAPKTVIEWEHGGTHVVALGSFDGWENEIELENHDGVFKASLELPEGRYEYKFKVDGEWALSKSKETDGDNNVLIVSKS